MANAAITLSLAGSMTRVGSQGPFKFRAFECIYQPSWYDVSIQSTADPSILNKPADDGGATPVKLQWVCDVGGKDYTSKDKTLRLQYLGVYPQGGVYCYEIRAQDRRVDLMRACSQLYFKKKKASDMIKAYADAHKLRSSVEATTTEYTLRQCTESDWDFIMDTALPRTGPEPYLLYIRDGDELVFAKRSKQQGQPTVFKYGGKIAAGGKEVNVNGYRSRLIVDGSNYPTRMVAFNKEMGPPYTSTYMADDKEHPYDPFGEKKPKPFTKVPSRIDPIIIDAGLNVDSELKVRSTWKAPFTLARLAVTCMPQPELQLGSVASFQASSAGQDAPKTFMQGDYLIYGLYHEMDFNIAVAQTTVFMERRAISKAS